jgi:hypothetical protein
MTRIKIKKKDFMYEEPDGLSAGLEFAEVSEEIMYFFILKNSVNFL